MFQIVWRQPNTVWGISPVIHGLSKYPTKEAAEKQVERFCQVFPRNRYFVQKAG